MFLPSIDRNIQSLYVDIAQVSIELKCEKAHYFFQSLKKLETSTDIYKGTKLNLNQKVTFF